ncbi:hypothetical protein AC578_9330 [Pseudocercospora eumusae]|uniref:Uncharacterized protein n=1 Tax=Pseudocercospora eumusae TaxID=321146 RepID=A0A139HNJ1_9PEZI|nr:hypothetical protein AC578_9330 [Pseudocercospora eumusae]
MLAAKTSAEVEKIVKVPNTHKGAVAIWEKKAAASFDSDAEMTKLREVFDRGDIKHVCIVKLHAQDPHKKGYHYSSLHCDRADEQRETATQEIIKYFERVYESHATKLQGYQALLHDLGLENGTTIAKCKELTNVRNGSRGCFINIYDFIDAERKTYRFPAVEPLRYYSIILDKIFPKKQAKQRTILRNMLVNMLGDYKGKQYDKGRESPAVRLRNLKLSYTAGYANDGANSKTNATPKRKKRVKKANGEHKGGNDGSAMHANEVSDSDDTSEPKTPGDEDVREATNLMKTLGIPNGV